MDYNIRKIKPSEYPILKEFTYQAIFNRDPNFIIPREILENPDSKIYYEQFGKKDDHCLVAIVNEKIVGAVWVRILYGKVKGYGNVDAKTPEFAVALLPKYRNYGIGTHLMYAMLSELKKHNYEKVSLSVQKDNYALKMYRAVGFEIVKELEQEYLLIYKFN